MNVLVTNTSIEGMRLDELPIFKSFGIVVSRIKHQGRVELAKPDDIVHVGDTLLAIGPAEELEEFRIRVGLVSRQDLRAVRSRLVMRRIVVTKFSILGKRIGELKFLNSDKVVVTRVKRANIEFVAAPETRLLIGDTLLVVGWEENIANVSPYLGRVLKYARRAGSKCANDAGSEAWEFSPPASRSNGCNE